MKKLLCILPLLLAVSVSAQTWKIYKPAELSSMCMKKYDQVIKDHVGEEFFRRDFLGKQSADGKARLQKAVDYTEKYISEAQLISARYTKESWHECKISSNGDTVGLTVATAPLEMGGKVQITRDNSSDTTRLDATIANILGIMEYSEAGKKFEKDAIERGQREEEQRKEDNRVRRLLGKPPVY